MNFVDTATAQLDFLKRQQQYCKNQLSDLPMGNLVKKSSKGKEYYYIDTGTAIFSLKNSPELYQQYKSKKALLQQLRSLQIDIPLLKKLLNTYQPIIPLENDWHNFAAEQNTGWKQDKKHLYQGVYYRSKSETLIASILTSYQFRFKYEVEYTVNGFKYYPDFLIERPRDKKIFLWEHFGKIDDEEYVRKIFFKLQDYHNAGINLWDNLIITFDLADGSLNADYIDRIIKLYLL